MDLLNRCSGEIRKVRIKNEEWNREQERHAEQLRRAEDRGRREIEERRRQRELFRLVRNRERLVRIGCFLHEYVTSFDGDRESLPPKFLSWGYQQLDELNQQARKELNELMNVLGSDEYR